MIDAQVLRCRPCERAMPPIPTASEPQSVDPIDDGSTKSICPSHVARSRHAALIAEVLHGSEARSLDELGGPGRQPPLPLARQGGVDGLIGRALVELQHLRVKSKPKKPAATGERRVGLAKKLLVSDLDELVRVKLIAQPSPPSDRVEPVSNPVSCLADPPHADAGCRHVARIAQEKDELATGPDVPNSVKPRVDGASSHHLAASRGKLSPHRPDKAWILEDRVVDAKPLRDRRPVLGQPPSIPRDIWPSDIAALRHRFLELANASDVRVVVQHQPEHRRAGAEWTNDYEIGTSVARIHGSSERFRQRPGGASSTRFRHDSSKRWEIDSVSARLASTSRKLRLDRRAGPTPPESTTTRKVDDPETRRTPPLARPPSRLSPLEPGPVARPCSTSMSQQSLARGRVAHGFRVCPRRDPTISASTTSTGAAGGRRTAKTKLLP